MYDREQYGKNQPRLALTTDLFNKFARALWVRAKEVRLYDFVIIYSKKAECPQLGL
jgi:hypothetical protein